MESTKLKDITLKLLRDRPASTKLAQVSEASGLPLSWLKKFHSAGEKFTPSGDKLVILYEHLAQRKLL